MRIGIKFSPPENQMGSQCTFAKHLITTLYKTHQDVILYGSSATCADLPSARVRSYSSPLTKPHSLGRMAINWISEQLTFETRVARDGCDVLFCPFTYDVLVRTSHVPQVVVVHDLIPLVYPKMFPKTSRAWRWAFLPALRHAAAVVTVSEHSRVDLLRVSGLNPDKVVVVPDAYSSDLTTAPQTVQANEKYLLYVSSSHYPYKNILGLLNAFALVRDALPHRLVIVGSPVIRFSGEIKETMVRLCLHHRVQLRSNVPDGELSELYASADLFVYPSLYEGFGMPPLEAMASGVPVVASDRTSIPEVCGEAAYYVDAADPQKLASGILAVLSDTELRASLIKRGRHRVRQFSWARTAEGILQVCANVVNQERDLPLWSPAKKATE